MYWHRILEEYLNRSVEGSPKYYLPPLEDPSSQDSPKTTRIEYNERLNLPGGLHLTHREAECMHWMLRGETMKRIALRLSLSPRTVEYYMKRLKDRWKCKNKKDLILALQLQGFTHYVKVDERDEHCF